MLNNHEHAKRILRHQDGICIHGDTCIHDARDYFLNLVSQVRVLPGALASSSLLLHTVCCKFVREFIVSL
jgi:hypothetical protein